MALDTNIDKIRLLITDNDPNYPIFSDTELEFFLSENGSNIYLASAQALEVNAVDKARLAKRKQIDGVSEDNTEISDKLLALSDKFKIKATEKTSFDVSVSSWIDSETLEGALQNLGGLL